MGSIYMWLKFRYGLSWGVKPRRSVCTVFYLMKRFSLLVAVACCAFVAYSLSDYADAATRAKIETQNASDSLRPALEVLEKCLTKGDNAIYVGDELWFVGAASTGIKLGDTNGPTKGKRAAQSSTRQ